MATIEKLNESPLSLSSLPVLLLYSLSKVSSPVGPPFPRRNPRDKLGIVGGQKEVAYVRVSLRTNSES